jgi:hypothetical protein
MSKTIDTIKLVKQGIDLLTPIVINIIQLYEEEEKNEEAQSKRSSEKDEGKKS